VGVVEMLAQVCRRLRRETGLNEVALSGGVWQNATLLRLTAGRLAAAGFVIHTHRQVPANDGGLALGQAAIAAAWQSGVRPQVVAAAPAVPAGR
jgi:hydrogenase maturation protein HypF